MRLRGAFTVLLLLISGASAETVARPTNVTVSCQNLKVKVSWAYGQRRPQTSFRVTLTGDFGRVVRETKELQYDLTRFIWISEERYMDSFWVTVAAVLGGNQSQPETRTFTFNKAKTAALMCELDFPPADLSVGESGATLSFINPFSFYRELKEATKLDAAPFVFNVITAGGEKGRFSCPAKTMKCKHDITLPDGEECVTLDGWLFDGIGVGQVWFKETGRICDSKPAEDQLKLLFGLLAVFIILISLVSIIICKVRAWTMKTPQTLPSCLNRVPGEGLTRYDPVAKTDHLVLQVVPDETPSVGCESSGEELGAAGWIRDDESGDSSVKTECVSIDSEEEEEEEEERSGYDCPHTLQVDLGDGEMATGYRG